MIYGQTQVPIELALTAARGYRDIFNEVTVDVVFTAPSARSVTVPAFWAGGGVFRVRYASPEPGRHTYISVCSNPADAGLHGQSGAVELAPYAGSYEGDRGADGSALYGHGRLRVPLGSRTLAFADGTPFFWLADTWWYGMTARLDWPTGTRALALDRAHKGFTVIQLVAGMPCDIDTAANPFDPQYANEGGLPWEEGWTRINPGYYDMADVRITYLIEAGLVPCILGSWGYFLHALGTAKMRQHWRNLVARYAAYPVVWCLAGEVTLPTYSRSLANPWPADLYDEMARLAQGWTEMARYVRALDPYHNPLTAHPWPFESMSGRKALREDGLIDLDMLQTGHGGYGTLEPTLEGLKAALAEEPALPVLVGEVNYEGILGGNGPEIERFLFWACMAAGAAGHTYGCQGIWQMNSQHHPPHRGYTPSWGEGTWQEAMSRPGSAQVGLARRFLARYPWWRFTPRAEPALPEGRLSALAMGIPGALAIYYLPAETMPPRLCGIRAGRIMGPAGVVTVEPGAHYRAFYFDPRHGDEIDLGAVVPDADGHWAAPTKPSMEDWVLVLEDKEQLA